MALRTVEVVGEGAQALVHPALGPGELVGERVAGALLSLGEGNAPRFCQTALLGGKHRCRLGPLAGEDTTDLLGVRSRLLGNGFPDGQARLGHES